MALTDNLVSYWKLNEPSGTRYDCFGSNHLTDNNTVGNATGVISNGADFELSNSEYLSIAHASQVGLSITGDISVSFWVKVEQVGIEVGFIDKMKWTATRAGYSFNMDNGNNFQVLMYDSSGNLSRYAVTGMFGAGDVGNWVHVAASWTAASPATMLIYKNGTAQTVTTVSSAATSINTNTIDFNIGRYNSTNYLDGVMDEVAIWSRAITAVEIGQLYNAGAGNSYPFGAQEISYESASQHYAGVSATSTTTQNVAGADTIGFCFVADDALGTTTVNWGANSMTAIANITDTGGFFKFTAFYLINPPTGSQSVVATRSINTNDFYSASSWYTGAKQTGQPDSSATSALTAGTSFTQSTTVVAANSWMVCVAGANSGGLAASTGSTLRGAILNTFFAQFDSDGTVGTGSQSMIQTMTSGLRTGIIVSFSPATAGGGATFTPRATFIM